MNHRKSADPLHRLGVFKSLDEVPPHRRLGVFVAEYDGEDTFSDYCETVVFTRYDSDWIKNKTRIAGDRWIDHTDDCGRHHALADPEHVESWATALLDDYTIDTVYEVHWPRIAGFYEWLLRRTDHPHTYSPVLMAAAVPSSATRRVWDYKTDKYKSRFNGGNK